MSHQRKRNKIAMYAVETISEERDAHRRCFLIILINKSGMIIIKKN